MTSLIKQWFQRKDIQGRLTRAFLMMTGIPVVLTALVLCFMAMTGINEEIEKRLESNREAILGTLRDEEQSLIHIARNHAEQPFIRAALLAGETSKLKTFAEQLMSIAEIHEIAFFDAKGSPLAAAQKNPSVAVSRAVETSHLEGPGSRLSAAWIASFLPGIPAAHAEEFTFDITPPAANKPAVISGSDVIAESSSSLAPVPAESPSASYNGPAIDALAGDHMRVVREKGSAVRYRGIPGEGIDLEITIPIGTAGQPDGYVKERRRLGRALATQIAKRTGLDLLFIQNGQTLSGSRDDWRSHGTGDKVSIEGKDHRVVRIPLADGLEAAGLLSLERRNAMQRNTILLSIVFVGLMLMCARYFARRITESIVAPIRSLVDVSGEIAEGNLAQRAERSDVHEIDSLAERFNQMSESLDRVVRELMGTATQCSSAATEMLSASEELSRSAENQSRQSEDATSAITEMSASIHSVTKNVEEANRAARTAADAADMGEKVAADAVAGMQKTATTVESASARIKELGESSKKIGSIVEVITQIAEQTSLLALNAAIEAARAGEQGKGFAVVADEVSKLAERVAKSAREIETIIEAIREQTTHAVKAMEDGTKEVIEVRGGVNAMGESLARIRATNANASELIDEATQSLKEQAHVISGLSDSMQTIFNVSKETAVTARESVGQAHELAGMAESLEKLVERFSVTEDEPQAHRADHRPAKAEKKRAHIAREAAAHPLAGTVS